MGYVLRSACGRKQGLAIPIRTRVFLIGSSPKSQIRSRKPGIGRRHCAILSRKKQLFLQDLESGYPTKVNGLTVTPGSRLPLKTGDHVSMGTMAFVIEERKRKKPAVPVAAPYGAPPVPMGRAVTAKPTRPAAVSVTSALARSMTASVAGHNPVRQPSNLVSLVILAALAIIGLGAGVGLSRAFLGKGNDEERRAERKEVKPPIEDNRLARRDPIKENPIDRKIEEPRKEIKQEKPVEVKKLEPPKEEPKKPEPPKEEPKKPEPPKEEPKKPDPPKEEPKKTDPPKEEPKKPDPPKEEPKKPEIPKEEPKKPTETPSNRVAFASHVLPLLKESCVSCHSGAKKKGGLDLSTIEAMLKGGDSGAAIVAGNAEKSPLFLRVDDDTMPPAGKALNATQKKLLQDWIMGANNGGFAK